MIDDLKGWGAAKKSFHLMQEQAITGIGFNAQGARTLSERIRTEMAEIEAEVEPQLPPKPLNKGELKEWAFPAKPFKKDGSVAATLTKWASRVGATINEEEATATFPNGDAYKIAGGQNTITTGIMRLSNQEEIKDWLVAQGWRPTLWNFKRDERGKPERDDRGRIIHTTPKMQDKGRLCPNLERMSGPMVKRITRWLSLRNRLSVIEGWLEDPRLMNHDGRISAGSAGLTPTFRQKHTKVVNLPKAQDSVILGKEVRSLFVPSRPGYVMVGYDASALENRVEAHYCIGYEGGKEHAETILEGDAHTKNVFVFFPEEMRRLGYASEEDVDKDDEDFKNLRNLAKSGRYALAYGCSPKKLAETLGKPQNLGETLYESFWNANPALKMLRERLELFWEGQGGKRWIPGIDGRRLQTRSKHSLVNTLFQGCGAIAMDYSGLYMDHWLGGLRVDEEARPCYYWNGRPLYRVAYMHDEYLWEVPEGFGDEIGEMGTRSIEESGKKLNLKVPLHGSYKVGMSWAECH